jgi:hypothetical protein
LDASKAEAFNEPAVAGGSIKPRVERSGTLGSNAKSLQARETGDSGVVCRPLRGLGNYETYKPRVPLRSTLGFMLPPAIAG